MNRNNSLNSFFYSKDNENLVIIYEIQLNDTVLLDLKIISKHDFGEIYTFNNYLTKEIQSHIEKFDFFVEYMKKNTEEFLKSFNNAANLLLIQLHHYSFFLKNNNRCFLKVDLNDKLICIYLKKKNNNKNQEILMDKISKYFIETINDNFNF